jgi:sugar lactone lactonase YvrE
VVGGVEVFMLSETGNMTPFVRIDADPGLVRLNDAKCDPNGNLWVGTAANDLDNPSPGALYRIDPAGRTSVVLRDVMISNGLGWNAEGTTFFYVDSYTHALEAFDCDALSGALSNRRTIATLEWGAGVFDGLAVDTAGCVWVAVMGSGQVRQYAPNGVLLAYIETSAPCVTSCAFGGVDRSQLIITSAAIRMPPAAVKHGFSSKIVTSSSQARGAGGVFVCTPGSTGVSATPFGG